MRRSPHKDAGSVQARLDATDFMSKTEQKEQSGGVCSDRRCKKIVYYIYSAVDRSFGSVFSFSGEYSYFRFAGTVCSVGCGE